MTPNKYKKLREKIIEAVPGIVELKGECRYHFENKKLIIDGRPIRLADVLIAIREKDKELKKDKSYEFNSHVLDPDISIAIDDLVNIHWNLKTNTLKDQSPELYAFLWELLGEGE